MAIPPELVNLFGCDQNPQRNRIMVEGFITDHSCGEAVHHGGGGNGGGWWECLTGMVASTGASCASLSTAKQEAGSRARL